VKIGIGENGVVKTHRSSRSMFLRPGCAVTSHRQCTSLFQEEDLGLDPAPAEPVDARDHVYVVGDSPRSSLHQNRKHDCNRVGGSF
jgi:hypothetical protein